MKKTHDEPVLVENAKMLVERDRKDSKDSKDNGRKVTAYRDATVLACNALCKATSFFYAAKQTKVSSAVLQRWAMQAGLHQPARKPSRAA